MTQNLFSRRNAIYHTKIPLLSHQIDVARCSSPWVSPLKYIYIIATKPCHVSIEDKSGINEWYIALLIPKKSKYMHLIHNKLKSDAQIYKQVPSMCWMSKERKGKGGKRKRRDNHALCMRLDAQGKIEGNEPKRWTPLLKIQNRTFNLMSLLFPPKVGRRNFEGLDGKQFLLPSPPPISIQPNKWRSLPLLSLPNPSTQTLPKYSCFLKAFQRNYIN